MQFHKTLRFGSDECCNDILCFCVVAKRDDEHLLSTLAGA